MFCRHGTDLTRAFSDTAAAASVLPPGDIDGELIAVTFTGEVSFGRPQTRTGEVLVEPVVVKGWACTARDASGQWHHPFRPHRLRTDRTECVRPPAVR
ncbi:hypothetical protein ABTX81_06195 [Kitasatospora sp. NPDC097605]|uniref:hypothetical protein n=1 Tax=Kitasatospora sp. NPDC097605 TaxID=3157226 RepID=UPI003318C2ED